MTFAGPGRVRRRRQPRHRRDGRRSAGPGGCGGRGGRPLRARGQGARAPSGPSPSGSRLAGGRALPVACDVTSEESVDAAVAATICGVRRHRHPDRQRRRAVARADRVHAAEALAAVPERQPDRCLPGDQGGHPACAGARRRIADRDHHDRAWRMVEHGANAYWVSKAGVERLYLGLAADLRADNIAVNCLSPSRVVLTEGWQAGGGGMQIPPEMVEPPQGDGRRRRAAGRSGCLRGDRHHPAQRSAAALRRAAGSAPR